MKVRRLWPAWPPVPRHQCECLMEDMAPSTQMSLPRYRRTRAERQTLRNIDPLRCMCLASWEVDGMKLCTRHAGARALEWLTDHENVS